MKNDFKFPATDQVRADSGASTQATVESKGQTATTDPAQATIAGSVQTFPLNPVQAFLVADYDFRRNLISDKIEFRERGTEAFRVLSQDEQNSILMLAEAAMPEEKRLRDRLLNFINSRATHDYDPAANWLQSLPQWDGKNHIDALLDRIPGLQADERYWLHVWLRSAVAHWLQMDSLHGNELVPTFIGEQGCGKSTFCRLLLPEHLRQYYLDHVNLSNKFDKEMALTNNLIVNIDELDQVRRSQQAELKQLLSKSCVNGRPIYGKVQKDRRRYASFVATTNNRHPLHDPTGSRRFLCIEIPDGKLIDNLTPINYEQVYAQLREELQAGERYWFTEEETRAIQRHNTPYQSTLDMERIVSECFRKPEVSEPCQPITMMAVLDKVMEEYPFIKPLHSTKVQLGNAFAALGFQSDRKDFGNIYYAVTRE